MVISFVPILNAKSSACTRYYVIMSKTYDQRHNDSSYDAFLQHPRVWNMYNKIPDECSEELYACSKWLTNWSHAPKRLTRIRMDEFTIRRNRVEWFRWVLSAIRSARIIGNRWKSYFTYAFLVRVRRALPNFCLWLRHRYVPVRGTPRLLPIPL